MAMDGDRDLLVVTGGVEGDEGSVVYRDHLYLNDGKGTFSDVTERALPDKRSSSSALAAEDFDGDGDIDFYIGGRVVPGSYPLTPSSQLLRNDSANGTVTFVDVAKDHGVQQTGMVTAAQWGDMNGDGLPDLMLAHEWGSVNLFLNSSNGLKKANSAELDARIGWWSALVLADVDADGDLDCIAGNHGQNTKYHATAEKPELLYYGTFDDTGKPRIIEAKFEDETCLPRRGYSCSSNAMPALRAKLPTFHSFASKSLESIYSASRLESALRLEANTLDSGIFFNDGDQGFRFVALPRIAQAFPVNAIAVEDFNADGKPDIFLAGNSHSPQRETGNADGGVSLLLLGGERESFSPVWPNRSGLVVPGDARDVAITDLNGDGRPDIVVARNNDEILAFENRSEKER